MTLKPTPTNIPLVPSKMAADQAPIKIGAKGTVGSLMMKEIEYFNRLGVQSQKHGLQVDQEAGAAKSNSGHKKTKIDSVVTMPKRKKRASKFMPSICSVIDVADNNGPAKLVSGFGYRPLKADVRRLQV